MLKNQKYISVILLSIVLILSSFGLFYFLKNSSKENTANTSDSKSAIIPKKACELFSLESAKNVLGEEVKLLNSYDGTNPEQTNTPAQKDAPQPVAKDPASDKVDESTLAKFNKQDNYQTIAAVTTCAYTKSSLSGKDASEKALRITVRSSSSEQAEKDFNATQKSSKPVEDLGVSAYWAEGKDILGKAKSVKANSQLYVLKGENLIVIYANNDLGQSKEVAKQVLENL